VIGGERMGNSENRDIGLVFRCAGDTSILEIIHDGAALLPEPSKGTSWTSMLDEGSIAKSQSFMQEITDTGAAFNWELAVKFPGSVEIVQFAGIFLELDSFLLMGAVTNQELKLLINDFFLMGSQQSNNLRAVLKENERLQKLVHTDTGLYDEITNLNNELINLQRELSRKNSELERLNEIKNHFLGIAAHDLRSPLGNIMMLIEFIEDDVENCSPEQLEYLTKIKDLNAFMRTLVEDLLDVTSIETGKLVLNLDDVNLVDLVRESVHLNEPLAQRKEIAIHFATDVENLAVSIDSNKIEQVINNLVSNAVKFSNRNTEIEVTLKRQDSGVSITVRDQGQGIQEDEINRLFEPFQKTSTRGTDGEKSSGLGLYICRKIVTEHGGDVSVESEYGKGSQFIVNLPVK
jgi:signal transduction histidine kinase